MKLLRLFSLSTVIALVGCSTANMTPRQAKTYTRVESKLTDSLFGWLDFFTAKYAAPLPPAKGNAK